MYVPRFATKIVLHGSAFGGGCDNFEVDESGETCDPASSGSDGSELPAGGSTSVGDTKGRCMFGDPVTREVGKGAGDEVTGRSLLNPVAAAIL